MTAFHLPTTAPDLYLARDLHAPTVVAVDGADSRNPEGTAAVTLCRACSVWDGEDLARVQEHPCKAWTAAQTVVEASEDPWFAPAANSSPTS